MNLSWLRSTAFGLAALTAMMTTPARAAEPTALEAAEGLWSYTLLKAGKTGVEMPLNGVILFRDGLFAQQSVFEGEPFEQQGSMGHAGTYGPGPRGIHMVAEQTIATAPDKDKPLMFRRDTLHDISVDRNGDELTIVFSSGTTQKFRRIGPASGDIYRLENGVLALVDGHFVLVAGDEGAVATGYGTYRADGSSYELDLIRWTEATPEKATNRKEGTIKASFDGKTLSLADGRSFRVATKQ